MDNKQPLPTHDINQEQAIMARGPAQTAPPPPPSGLAASQPAPSDSNSQNQPILLVTDEAEMDKAWVDRAVVLLDKTREDPFLQSQEIAKLKAQYMQSRFDKQIKIAQEQK